MHPLLDIFMVWGLGMSYYRMSCYDWNIWICCIYFSCLFNYIRMVLNCETFVLKFGGGFGGRFLTDLLCGSISNDWKNTCVKSGKYPEELSTLISLIRVWNCWYNASTDRYYCVLVVGLNICWFNPKKIWILNQLTPGLLCK